MAHRRRHTNQTGLRRIRAGLLRKDGERLHRRYCGDLDLLDLETHRRQETALRLALLSASEVPREQLSWGRWPWAYMLSVNR